MSTQPFPTITVQASRSMIMRVILRGAGRAPHARPLWLAAVITVFAPLLLLALSLT